MAEDQDQSQKTEEPTQRRLDEARQKGQVASSREVNHAFMLGAGALFVAVLAPGVARDVGGALLPFVAAPHSIDLDASDLSQLLVALLLQVGAAMLLAALLFIVAALAGSLVQNGFLWTTQPLAPKAERVSPLAGAKRLFSLKSLVEFTKGVVKISLVGALAVGLLWPAQATILASVGLEPAAVLAAGRQLALRLLVGVTALTLAIALLDTFYQRFEHRKQLRMSRRDLQDEFKQTEGDPHLKARLKGLRMERARRRMMAEVPKATVVITNPVHVAVALRYDESTMGAPQVVAKGADELAQRIREVARQHDVPIVENPPLARTLHAAVEVGAEVPSAHYQAVAEVIGFVLRLGDRR